MWVEPHLTEAQRARQYGLLVESASESDGSDVNEDLQRASRCAASPQRSPQLPGSSSVDLATQVGNSVCVDTIECGTLHTLGVYTSLSWHTAEVCCGSPAYHQAGTHN
eukprot:9486157-Pyramimonas_sp.AAC.2